MAAPKYNFNTQRKSNPLEALIFKDYLTKGKQQEARGGIGQASQDISNQMGGQIPPGSKLTDSGFNIPLNREFSKDEISTLNNFDSVKSHIGYLRNSMTTNPDGFKKDFIRANVPFGEIGSKGAQMIKFRLSDLSDRLLRLRSGAQINNQEYARLRSLLPNLTDMTSGDFDVINAKLDTFEKEFTLARERVLGGSRFEQGRGISPIPGSPPAISPRSGLAQTNDPSEGKTAVNPQTGQRLVRRGGKWLPT